VNLGSSEEVKAEKMSVMTKDIADLSADKPTIKERLSLFLKFEFSGQWFTSLVVKSQYERQYGVEIKLSTVSTYLTRLTGEGFLERRHGFQQQWHDAAQQRAENQGWNRFDGELETPRNRQARSRSMFIPGALAKRTETAP